MNCGDTANLCGTPPNPADACYDTYMVRYDCAGAEQWATKLTSSSATNPPYTFGSGYNYMVWWYQHQGRIAFDGTNYAAYFCDAIVVQNTTCANNSTGTTGGIDIHEGDKRRNLDERADHGGKGCPAVNAEARDGDCDGQLEVVGSRGEGQCGGLPIGRTDLL